MPEVQMPKRPEPKHREAPKTNPNTAGPHSTRRCRTFQKANLGENSQDEWLITYADAVTLILAFFVLIFSISEISQTKFEALQTSLGHELLKKEEVVNPLEKLETNLSEILETHDISPEEALNLNENQLRIDLPGELLFRSASTDLSPESQRLLRSVADEIKAFPLPNYLIEIEGHTDDVPISTTRFPSNWALSSGRAISVLKVFFESGIDKHRLKAIGYADTRPKVPNEDEFGRPIPENRAENRRVEIKVARNPDAKRAESGTGKQPQAKNTTQK
ncbi:MAG: flagellar motor protein MotB [Hydrogenovibrio sp.]|uniref:OmpA/MotB family protein n=1 Tax=Hydrogenovibrio sp. TaxID=2065821 RepID=UPI0028704163|nr:flagellar motor protein MotB [Hydrogenovibrio sp.]MDR9499421.1 flagellar motor protein MotB [Hydrogenovibrio sp.]